MEINTAAGINDEPKDLKVEIYALSIKPSNILLTDPVAVESAAGYQPLRLASTGSWKAQAAQAPNALSCPCERTKSCWVLAQYSWYLMMGSRVSWI